MIILRKSREFASKGKESFFRQNCGSKEKSFSETQYCFLMWKHFIRNRKLQINFFRYFNAYNFTSKRTLNDVNNFDYKTN